jgi:hypothetical protein
MSGESMAHAFLVGTFSLLLIWVCRVATNRGVRTMPLSYRPVEGAREGQAALREYQEKLRRVRIQMAELKRTGSRDGLEDLTFAANTLSMRIARSAAAREWRSTDQEDDGLGENVEA